MAATLQKRPVAPHITVASQHKVLNAEAVTSVATNFLKRIGNKGALKPKKATLKEKMYIVEVDMKKHTAIVHIDSETHEIKEYEMQLKTEETSSTLVVPKTLLITFGISATVWILFYFTFKIFGL